MTPNPAETDKELAGLEKPKEEREERRGALGDIFYSVCEQERGKGGRDVVRRPKIPYGVVRIE